MEFLDLFNVSEKKVEKCYAFFHQPKTPTTIKNTHTHPSEIFVA